MEDRFMQPETHAMDEEITMEAFEAVEESDVSSDDLKKVKPEYDDKEPFIDAPMREFSYSGGCFSKQPLAFNPLTSLIGIGVLWGVSIWIAEKNMLMMLLAPRSSSWKCVPRLSYGSDWLRALGLSKGLSQESRVSRIINPVKWTLIFSADTFLELFLGVRVSHVSPYYGVNACVSRIINPVKWTLNFSTDTFFGVRTCSFVSPFGVNACELRATPRSIHLPTSKTG
eukprot:scaffold18312_cov55-Attheya_sp.AAC.4